MRVPGGTIHGLMEKVANFFRRSRKAKHSRGRNCKQSERILRPINLYSTTGEVFENEPFRHHRRV